MKKNRRTTRVDAIYNLCRVYLQLCQEFNKTKKTKDITSMKIVAGELENPVFNEIDEQHRATIRGDFGVTLEEITGAKFIKIPNADIDFTKKLKCSTESNKHADIDLDDMPADPFGFGTPGNKRSKKKDK